MPTISTIVLSIKGDVRKANLQLNNDGLLAIDTLQKYFKKKDEPELVCSYNYDNKVISIFGYKKGKKGTENKVELPDPYSELALFGDALAIASESNKWENPISFSIDQWNNFYKGTAEEVEGDSDEDDEEEEEEEEEEESMSEEFVAEDEEKTSILDDEEDDDEETEEPVAVVKRKKQPIYAKVDSKALKEEIAFNSEPETNKLRVICLNSLEFLADKFSKNDIRALERGIFEASYRYAQKNYVAISWKSPNFIDIYRQTVKSVLSNIHPESPVKNPRLLNRVFEGEFDLSEIPAMSAYEMFPEKWFELKDKLLQREQKILEGNKSRATDQFKCRRCGKRECTYYELQTRSADEPMTIFVTCLNCGKEWRNGG
jgi:transcription elongation factor S-II